MSTLLVEVCKVASVERHPHADRLGIATVKGWKTVIGFDPATDRYEFAPGEKCVYFPPDSILPPALANSPFKVCKERACKAYNKTPAPLAPKQQPADGRCALCGGELRWRDGTPGRTGAMAFCAELPADENGTRPPGGRVRAARLRGVQSFGFIMKLEPAQGDDLDWPVGTDLREHYGVTKWEPPIEAIEGDAEPPHPRFHAYTDVEHLANFPGAIADGDEVIFTEKIHGKNCRLGLILVDGDEGAPPTWTWMAGSHGQRRKELIAKQRRFDAADLLAKRALAEADVRPGHVLADTGGGLWRIVEVRTTGDRTMLLTEEVCRTGAGEHEQRLRRSEYWEPMTEPVRALLEHVRDRVPAPDGGPVTGVVLFGELYGTQDMKYGLTNSRGFRAFDLAVNGRYLDFDAKTGLCEQFGVDAVPVLYRGPFSTAAAEAHTDGPTAMCPAESAGRFAGREGIVVTPAVERIDARMMATGTNGRVILKSISADYLARKGGTDAR